MTKHLPGLALAALLLAGTAAADPEGKPASEIVRKTMAAYIDAFNAGDPVAVTALYEDTATVEDPAGSAPHKGKPAIEQFYKAVCSQGAKLEPVSINPAPDGSGAMLFQIRVKAATINVIDVMTFNDAGKITGMKAYTAFVPAPR